MRVLSVEQLMQTLRCTSCGGSLDLTSVELWIVCTNERCERKRPYPLVHRVPVMVDEHSIVDEDSVVTAGGASPVRRRQPSKMRSGMKRLLFGSRSAGVSIAKTFVRSLPGGPGSRVLIVGGATVGAGVEQVATGVIDLVSLDVYYSEDVSVVADAHNIPFVDGSFDGVWVQSVLEHVLAPAQVVAEIFRVLRPGGVVFAESSFLEPVHEGAFDFYRFTPSGHRWLFRDFCELDAGVAAGLVTSFGLSVEYFARGLSRSRSVGKILKAVVSLLRFIDRVLDPRTTSDAAALVYFLGMKGESGITAKDIVAYYRGRDHEF